MSLSEMPLTAKEALELWDSGCAVPAFQVETTPERQNLVYAAAFELLRESPDGAATTTSEGWSKRHQDLSERECYVAISIVQVAKQSGWAKMVSQHVHCDSPAITVRKPQEKPKEEKDAAAGI